jgi:hypothetical protein
MSLFIGAALSVGGAALGAISANKAKREAERKAGQAEEEMNRLKDAYSQLDTSNPYADMENTMEDLTINQRQYDLEKQQFQQSQGNILGGLREAAGSSGIAAVAQALAGEAQIAAQSSSSQIGAQERQNQMKERQMAANLQDQERQGEVWSRNAERDKQATLLGMSQQEVAAYREQAAAANQAKWDAIAGGVSAVGSIFEGVGARGCCCPTCDADFGEEAPEPEQKDDVGGQHSIPCPGSVPPPKLNKKTGLYEQWNPETGRHEGGRRWGSG